jgi:CHAD domain-containing protein
VLGDRLPVRGEPDGTGKRATAGAVVLAYLREQVAILRSQDPLVRIDAADAVHKSRVTARRIRSVLQGYRRVLDRSSTADLVADLRWLGAELAPARDGEVLAAHIAKALDALPDDEVLGPVAAQVTRRFAREQTEGRARALGVLDSDRYLQMQDRLDALLDAPPTTRRADEPATAELPRAIRKSLRRTAGHAAEADAAVAAERDTALHEMRKAAKRARYVLEVAEAALGKGARKLRKRAKEVQSLLGDHHDTVVARAVLRELGGQAQVDGANGFTFGVLYAEERAAARALERRLPSRWSQVTKRADLA